MFWVINVSNKIIDHFKVFDAVKMNRKIVLGRNINKL